LIVQRGDFVRWLSQDGFPAIGKAEIQCLLHIWENCGILVTDHGTGTSQALSIARSPKLLGGCSARFPRAWLDDMVEPDRRTWIAYGNLVSTFTIHSPIAGLIHLQLDLYNIIAIVFCPSGLACLCSGKQKEKSR
jgi:hypothetical protein